MTAVVRKAKNQFNLAAQSARQAGSTFKTFVLASAIEKGVDPDSTYYTSAPFTCVVRPWCNETKPWDVHTYDSSYRGTESVTSGTLQSDNTIYAQLTLDVGPSYVWNFARRLGVHMSPNKPVASIGLGSLAVSPLDMAAAYATFPAMGIYAKPRAITKVMLPGGKVDTSSGWGKPQTKRAVSQGVAWKVNDVLRQNAQYGTGAGSGDGIHPNAGKTGTTENHADAWFDGYTRQLSTVVWMGYQQGEIPMTSVHGQSVAGATFPVPIWHEYMAAALWNRPAIDFATPNSYPSWHYLHKGYFGPVQYYAPPRGTDHDDDGNDAGDAPGEAGQALTATAAAHTRAASSSRQRAPSTRAAGSSARTRRVPASASPRRRSSSPARRVIAAASADGIVRRHEESRRSVVEQLAGSFGVGGDHGRAGREPVEDGRRDRPRLAKTPEHDPGVRDGDSQVVGRNLAADDDAGRDIGQLRGRPHDVSRFVASDARREVDGGERIGRRPLVAIERLIRAEEHRGDVRRAERLEVAGLGVRPADDEIRQAERAQIDGAQQGGRG